MAVGAALRYTRTSLVGAGQSQEISTFSLGATAARLTGTFYF